MRGSCVGQLPKSWLLGVSRRAFDDAIYLPTLEHCSWATAGFGILGIPKPAAVLEKHAQIDKNTIMLGAAPLYALLPQQPPAELPIEQPIEPDQRNAIPIEPRQLPEALARLAALLRGGVVLGWGAVGLTCLSLAIGVAGIIAQQQPGLVKAAMSLWVLANLCYISLALRRGIHGAAWCFPVVLSFEAVGPILIAASASDEVIQSLVRETASIHVRHAISGAITAFQPFSLMARVGALLAIIT